VETSFELYDVETRLADRSSRVARRYAAAKQTRPEQRIDRALKRPEGEMLRPDVLIEPQLTAWSHDAV
jgi:hypothetical protein